jgi:hypothetical protein
VIWSFEDGCIKTEVPKLDKYCCNIPGIETVFCHLAYVEGLLYFLLIFHPFIQWDDNM